MSETKPSNPKDAVGIKKVPLSCVPTAPLLEVGLAMMEGARKYGRHNYRVIGVRASTYYDAAMRHLMSWWEGEDIDPDSGVHHLVKAAACTFVVRDAMIMGKCEDDRPVKYPSGLPIQKFNSQAADLIKKYPECKEPYLEAYEMNRGYSDLDNPKAHLIAGGAERRTGCRRRNISCDEYRNRISVTGWPERRMNKDRRINDANS